MGISVVWEVDIQDDNENEKKIHDKEIYAKKLGQRSIR